MTETAFSPSALARYIERRGLGTAELARAVGVSERAVQYWLAGRSAPGDRSFGRLLAVLRCDAQELCGRLRGTETLSDLRRDAGLEVGQAAAAVAERPWARDLGFDVGKLRALELGRAVAGWDGESPEMAGRVARALARVYGVPERVLLDAWRRSRPVDGAVPILPRREPGSGEASGPLAVWEELNERQRIYLACLFWQDQEEELLQQRSHARGGVRSAAREWRRMPLALDAPKELVGLTRLQERLRHEGVRDPGVGSSVAALRRRGLVTTYRDRVYIDGVGEVARTLVEVTRRGRSVARAALKVPNSKGTPAPLLSRWLWSVLVRVARAGGVGLDGSLAGRAPHALAVGRSPDGHNPSRGFIVLRHPDGVDSGPYFWFLTDSGRQHVKDYLGLYQELYPEVGTSDLNSAIE
ncbi:helix-turn-helix domain-containing protein [Kitasatospora cineracea]|nr:helix-turn-helix transcriptional regulator [Kitasatospora cineracea]